MHQPQVFRPRFLLTELNQVQQPMILDLHMSRSSVKGNSVDRVRQLKQSSDNVENLVDMWIKHKQQGVQTPQKSCIKEENAYVIKEIKESNESSPQNKFQIANSIIFESSQNSARKAPTHKKAVSVYQSSLSSSETFTSKNKPKPKPKLIKESQLLVCQLQKMRQQIKHVYSKVLNEDQKFNAVDQYEYVYNQETE